MFNHEPLNYKCPLCFIAQGREEENFPYTRREDVIYKDDLVTAFIASHWWPNNKGHIIVISNKHFENIYDLPNAINSHIATISKKMAIALKTIYKCDGVSTRQHNEHAGNQDVWHYHLHIFPRYENDNYYGTFSQGYLSDPKDRKEYSRKLKQYFEKIKFK